MLKKYFKFCLMVTLICSSGSLLAQESMIQDVSYPYLERLIDAAKQNYPKIQINQHRMAVARAEIRKSQLSWLSPLGFTYQYSPNNTTTLVNPSFLNGYQIGLSLNVGSFIQTPAVIKQAKENLKVTQAENDEYLVNLTAVVQQRYFTYIRQISMLKLTAKAVTDAASVVNQLKYLFEKGQATYEDYNTALLSLNNKAVAKIDAEGAYLISKSALEELVGKKLEEIK